MKSLDIIRKRWKDRTQAEREGVVAEVVDKSLTAIQQDTEGACTVAGCVDDPGVQPETVEGSLASTMWSGLWQLN